MSRPEIREVRLAELEERLIPTKRLGNAAVIQDAKILIKERADVPPIVVVKDIGGDMYLVAFGHNVVAGALMALDEDPSLADHPLPLKEITSPKIKLGGKVYTRAQFSARLFNKAKLSWHLTKHDEVNWGPFKAKARALIEEIDSGFTRPVVSPTQFLEFATAAPAANAPADDPAELPGDTFNSGNSSVINVELLQRRIEQSKKNVPPPPR